MESHFVHVHTCLTKRKARRVPVVIMAEPWEDKHGTVHATLTAHRSDCKGARA